MYKVLSNLVIPSYLNLRLSYHTQPIRFVLGIDAHWNRIMVFNVLDSIGKGGALAGIENMNIMFGFDRSTGLARHASELV